MSTRFEDTFDVDHAFVSISTDGPASALHLSTTSIALCSAKSGNDPQFVSRGSDGTLPALLARTVAPKDRPLTSWFWSDEFASAVSFSETVDTPFESRILRGLTNLGPPLPAWNARDPRVRGSLQTKRRPRLLVDRGIDIDLQRCRHIETIGAYWPTIELVEVDSKVAIDSMHVFHNAIRLELRDLQRVLTSMQTRLLDIDNNDTVSFYAWLDGFSDFLRLYFAASERFVLNVVEDASDMELRGEMGSRRRKSEKLRIVRMLEDIESLKRPMQAHPSMLQQLLPKLSEKVETFSKATNRCLATEAENLPSILLSYFHEQQIAEMFSSVKSRLLDGASGPVLVVLLSRGCGSDAATRKLWLKSHSQQVVRGKASARAVVQRWTKLFVALHKEYVQAFLCAEQEYRSMYGSS
jgi:hypothetical protein